MRKRTRTNYTYEQKIEALRYCYVERKDRTITSNARSLGIPVHTVYMWKQEYGDRIIGIDDTDDFNIIDIIDNDDTNSSNDNKIIDDLQKKLDKANNTIAILRNTIGALC